MKSYVIITPAHNEEAFIEKTLQSVVGQNVRPLKWVIVNDASTDGTRQIVERYAASYNFIQLINVERAQGRHFGNKVRAFNRGLAAVAELPYDFIGNLDADISFEPHYFENMLRQFDSDPRLGISGGIVFTRVGDTFRTHDETLDSVGGAVQLFRRKCFEEIGGYMPLEFGGIDAAAEIIARMKGWKVRKSVQDPVYEHRRTGTANTRLLPSKIREGRRFYSLGYGLAFYSLRCVYRVKESPVVLGSAAAFVGYLLSMIGRRPRLLPREAIRHLKAEHRMKLKRALGLNASIEAVG